MIKAGGIVNAKTVRELMVPLQMCAVVSQDATLLDAVIAIEKAQERRDRKRQPLRAVLAVDEAGNIVGKLGQLSFLKALQPRRDFLKETSMLVGAGVTEQFMNSVMDHYRFFQDNLTDLCRRASRQHVRDHMHPVSENIDENASLGEAISKIIEWECLSAPVVKGGKVIGLLRLSDLCQEVAEYMKNLAEQGEES
jgi:CBS domain-containing protein